MPKSSKSSADTSVTTTTTTSIRDIGLTGQNAVDALAIIEAGGIERERIGAETITKLADYSQALIERNARNAVDLIQSGEGETDFVKIAPYVVAIVAAAAPLIFLKK